MGTVWVQMGTARVSRYTRLRYQRDHLPEYVVVLPTGCRISGAGRRGDGRVLRPLVGALGPVDLVRKRVPVHARCEVARRAWM